MPESYYSKNREKILSKRRLRYKTDPTFKETVKENFRRHRKKKQEINKVDRILKREAKNWRRFKLPDQTVHDSCNIGYLAKLLGLTTACIRLWEQQGFPKTFRVKNVRYYTKDNVNAILEEYHRKKTDRLAMYQFIKNVVLKWRTNGEKISPKKTEKTGNSRIEKTRGIK